MIFTQLLKTDSSVYNNAIPFVEWPPISLLYFCQNFSISGYYIIIISYSIIRAIYIFCCITIFLTITAYLCPDIFQQAFPYRLKRY